MRPTARLDRDRKLSFMSPIDSRNKRSVLVFCCDLGCVPNPAEKGTAHPHFMMMVSDQAATSQAGRNPSCAKTRPSRHRRKNCAYRNQAKTLAREQVTRRPPTLDCGSTIWTRRERKRSRFYLNIGVARVTAFRVPHTATTADREESAEHRSREIDPESLDVSTHQRGSKGARRIHRCFRHQVLLRRV